MNKLAIHSIINEDGLEIELDPAEPKYSQEYKQRVLRVAVDVAKLIKALNAEKPRITTCHRINIFVAECSYDLREEREKLCTELRQHGYRVFPEFQLPLDESEYIQEVDKILQQCSVSIHLIGGHYGAVPDGPTRQSKGVIQNNLAVNAAKNQKLRKRWIWLPKNTHSQDKDQQKFIDSLLTDDEAQLLADLNNGSFEEFKGSLFIELEAIEQNINNKTKSENNSTKINRQKKLVYILCVEKDKDIIRPIKAYLREHGCKVKLSLFKGDAETIRELQQEWISGCDGLIIFYGEGDVSWKDANDVAILKGKRERKGKSLVEITYVASPTNEDKEEFIEDDDGDIIDGRDGFAKEKFEAFLTALQDAGDLS